ncbi:MAG: VanZ family protein, partial [Halodesulfurarchaeum sp.]
LTLLFAGLIFYLSVFTVPPEQPMIPHFGLLPLDKWRHLLAYGALGLLLSYTLTDRFDRRPRFAATVFAVTVAFGFFVELVQGQVPQRYFSVYDAYANAWGATVVLPWLLLERFVTFAPVRDLVRSDAGR